MRLNRKIRPLAQGAGRMLDLYPDNRNRLPRIHPYSNDRAALQRDNARIGQDFWMVIHREPRPYPPR